MFLAIQDADITGPISENACFSMSGFTSQDLTSTMATDVSMMMLFLFLLLFLFNYHFFYFLDLLKFHRPVSGNIGKFEIICSLSLVDSTLPSPIYSDERTREGRVFFNTKDPLRRKLAKTIKTTLIRCVCFLLK